MYASVFESMDWLHRVETLSRCLAERHIAFSRLTGLLFVQDGCLLVG